MVVRTSILTTLLLAASLFASTDDESERLGRIQSKVNSILNKAGIHFNGTFRSQYMQSMLNEEESGVGAIDWGKKQTESNEYTSVDFDIGARPNDALSARCMFRMHQNWQNFFSDVSNPIFLRWMSIDGNIKNMFRFNVGDYRQRYSPLTLWSPDIDIAYEPEIFAEKRRQAMNEVFLGDNDRLLQGVNFNMDAEVVPIFNEFHLNVQASRLRLSEANVQNGAAVAADFENDNITLDKTYMDRYFIAGNLDIIALKGLGFGGTLFDIFDLPPTSALDGGRYDRELIARNQRVWAARIKPTTNIFLDTDAFSVGINFEVAGSHDRDSAWRLFDTTISGTDTTVDTSVADSFVDGMAIDAGLTGMFKFGEMGSLCLNVGFMNNDENFRNMMAQSPSFIGQRIMNIENDFAHEARLYTTFDALYDYVFKFTPSGTNTWTQEPRRKISYLNSILTRKELDSLDGVNARFDSTLQLVLPAGQATPNRSGPKADVRLKLFNGGVDVGGSFAMLTEIEPLMETFEKTKYLKAGGGFCVDIATWAKPLNALKLSLGYSLEKAEFDYNATAGGDAGTFNSGFMNLGLYYNFWKRFSILGGYQQIVSTSDITSSVAYEKTVTQKHWAAGLEYKVNDDQKVVGRFGQLGADFESTAPADSTISAFNFRAYQVDISLLVNF
jgi:hypothetical protein